MGSEDTSLSIGILSGSGVGGVGNSRDSGEQILDSEVRDDMGLLHDGRPFGRGLCRHFLGIAAWGERGGGRRLRDRGRLRVYGGGGGKRGGASK